MRNEFDIVNDKQTKELIEEIKEILKDFGLTIEEKYETKEFISYRITSLYNHDKTR